MTAIALISGAYVSQALTANAQRCVNLYPEINPKNTQPNMPVTHYPRPGLSVLCAPSAPSGPAPVPPFNPILTDETGAITLTNESGIPLTPP